MSILIPAAPATAVPALGNSTGALPAGFGPSGAPVRSALSPRRLTGVTMLADVAAVAALVAVAGSVGAPAAATNPAALTAFILLWLVLLIATRAYDTAPDLGLGDRSRSVLRAAGALGLICWIAPALSGIDVSAELLVLPTGVLGALALLVRIAVMAWSSRVVAAAGGVPLVVAGDAEDVARVVAELHRVGDGRWRVVAARVPEQSVGVVIDAPVEVGIDGLADIVVESGAEAVLLLPSRRLDPFRVRRLAWELETTGARLYVGTGLLDAVPGRTRLLALGDLDLVHLRPAQMRCSARLVKAVVERFAVVVLLVILAPLLAAVAVAIRLDSKGPVFYNQGRVGRDGRGFTMYKFRTMTDGADRAVAELAELNDSDGQVLFKIREDPRVTRVGGLLRRYSLDELPQLFNVLRGNMSLVGPRPALPCEVALYDLDPRRRLAVTPGMTGLWQVSGRSDLSWEDTVRLDLHYVDNWSLALDAGILCRTVRAVLGHRGAY